jgi:methylthioribose-1-phosphate isomerase
MTPEQALQNLDRAVSQLSATRETHVALQQSIAVLSQLVMAAKKEEKPPA